ncbi:nucleotidyltransferase family protein [Candidatus Woesearchaeota archaeon]|nr:nucleotidyltransferase family protein [Candidatus Woesearchaeota archaeon]
MGFIKKRALLVLRKNKVTRAGIFGSYAKGNPKKMSDVDIVIEPPKGIGFGFSGIKVELEDTLGKKVDLVTYNGLNPYLKERILREEVRIL